MHQVGDKKVVLWCMVNQSSRVEIKQILQCSTTKWHYPI